MNQNIIRAKYLRVKPKRFNPFNTEQYHINLLPLDQLNQHLLYPLTSFCHGALRQLKRIASEIPSAFDS